MRFCSDLRRCAIDSGYFSNVSWSNETIEHPLICGRHQKSSSSGYLHIHISLALAALSSIASITICSGLQHTITMITQKKAFRFEIP